MLQQNKGWGKNVIVMYTGKDNLIPLLYSRKIKKKIRIIKEQTTPHFCHWHFKSEPGSKKILNQIRDQNFYLMVLDFCNLWKLNSHWSGQENYEIHLRYHGVWNREARPNTEGAMTLWEKRINSTSYIGYSCLTIL